jgi:hypothetical protein
VMTPFSENHSSLRRVEAQCLARPNLLLFSHGQIRDLKWTPLSRPFFARNKLISGGV